MGTDFMAISERIETSQDGFGVFILRNEAVEVGVIPELGAKVAMLRDRGTGREWMWSEPGAGPLRRSAPGASFGDGNPVGADECLPTVMSCAWKGRALPDHGEAWALPWDLDRRVWAMGRIRTVLRLPVTPFTLEREVSLSEDGVRLDYTLTNQGPLREEYLWAIHPLFALREGDRLELPPEVAELRVASALGAPEAENAEQWAWPRPFPGFDLDRLRLGESRNAYVKAFAGPLREGWAAVANATAGGIELRWDAALHPYLGLWLTRGGYRGWHQLALEPTNGAPDSLAEAVESWRCFATLDPGEIRAWSVAFRLRH